MTTWTNKIKDENLNTCCLCGVEKEKKVLHLHHVNPAQKIGAVSSFRTEPEARKEAQKCILVCGNCHVEIHCGLHEEDFILSLPRAVSLEEIIPEVVEDPSKKKKGRPKNAKNKKKNEDLITPDNIVHTPPNITYNIQAPDYTVNCIRYSFQITFLTRIIERLTSYPKTPVDFEVCLDLLKVMTDMGLNFENESLLLNSLKDRDRGMSVVFADRSLKVPWRFLEKE